MEAKNIKCINSLQLKILAMIFMFCDHTWATIATGSNTMWLTNIGRLAFPIFAFQIAEGYAKTKDFNGYIRRMFLFALISEIPFNLMTEGGFVNPFHQNVMFTFVLALIAIRIIDRARQKGTARFIITLILTVVLSNIIGLITFVDYFGAGILMVILFYLFRDVKHGWIGELVGMYLINFVLLEGLMIDINLFGFVLNIPQQGLAIFSLIPIWLYNGKQGRHSKAIQYACYAFYPVHMLVLSLLALSGF